MEQPKINYYAGVKWGLQNPSVIVVGKYQHPPLDRLALVHEFYRQGVLLPEMVGAARDLADKFQIRKFFCDPSEPRFIERLKKEHLAAVNVKDEELAGINLISEWLQRSREEEAGACPSPGSAITLSLNSNAITPRSGTPTNLTGTSRWRCTITPLTPSGSWCWGSPTRRPPE